MSRQSPIVPYRTPLSEPSSQQAKGILFGLAAVLAWAAYNTGVAAGRADGFNVADLTMLRYLGATLALTPWVMLRPSAPAGRLSWGKVLVLLALAGPHFGILYNVAMPLTRLSHAVVISPGFSMIAAFVLSAAAAGRRPEARRVCGLAVLLAALLAIAMDRGSSSNGPTSPLWGDLIFVLTGTLYGTFSFQLGRWQGDAVRIIWLISALSLALITLPYLLLATPTSHSATAWFVQFILQGVLGGGLAIVFYTLSIQCLGSARAGIFPALTPIATVPLSLPLSGVIPSGLELTGVALAALGMILSLSSLASVDAQTAKKGM